LYARIGTPYCPTHKVKIKSQSIEEMTNKILDYEEESKVEIMAPIIRGEKGTHKDLLDKLRKEGYSRVRVNGELRDLSEEIVLEKTKKSNIEVIVDRIVLNKSDRSRLFEAIETSTKLANGKVLVKVNNEELLMSEKYACIHCNYSIDELEPRMFSFNSPYGACPECKGLGVKSKVDENLIVDDWNKSINDGAISVINSDNNIYFTSLEALCNVYKIDMNKPLKDLSRKELDLIFYGSDKPILFKYISKNGHKSEKTDYYEGIINNFQRRYLETTSSWVREWIEGFMIESECPLCHGARLSEGILSVLINDKNIYDLTLLSIKDLYNFIDSLKLTKKKKIYHI
jgi:excinuclease ABC subunit A